MGGSTEVNTGSKTMSQTYTWTAPTCATATTASFRAMCGAGGSIDAWAKVLDPWFQAVRTGHAKG